MDVIKCSSDPFSPVNVFRRALHMAKFHWKEANRGYYDKSKAAKELNRARTQLGRLLYDRPERYEPHFGTYVNGIPCGVVITGHDEDDYGEPCGYEFFLVDGRGYRAKWLEDKMARDDAREIDYECLRHRMAAKRRRKRGCA